MKIGNIEIKGKTILAPMAGITSYGYRTFMRSFGVPLCYTEMISDSGLYFSNEKTYAYLPPDTEARPTSIQLFGGTTERLLQGLAAIEKHTNNYDFIDLNLGCPMPKVTRNNGGSAWLKDPDGMIEMVESIVAKSKKPVTVKIRIGWDENNINFKELLPHLEKAGVAMIAIHLRTTAQLYSGKARYDLAHNIQDLVSVPLVISGDIYTLDDAIKALEVTKAEGVMLARGQLGNPFLATQIETYFNTGERLQDATLNDQLKYLEVLAKLIIEEKGEHHGVLTMRTIAPYFLKSYPHVKSYKTRLVGIKTFEDLSAIIGEIRSNIS